MPILAASCACAEARWPEAEPRGRGSAAKEPSRRAPRRRALASTQRRSPLQPGAAAASFWGSPFHLGAPLGASPCEGQLLGERAPRALLPPQLSALAPGSMVRCSVLQGIPLWFGDSPLFCPSMGKALQGLLWRSCSSLSRWPRCLEAEARGQKHPASRDPLFPLGASLKLNFA